MEPSRELIDEIEHLQEHLTRLKTLLLDEEKPTGQVHGHLLSKAQRKKLMNEIGASWTGPDAVEEIREQREKDYS